MSLASSSAARRIGALALAFAVLLSAGTGVVAAESFQGATGAVVVGPDETYDSIDGMAGTVIIRGTVTGDVSTAAGTVHVTETGTVDGSVNAAAGTVRIDGTVGGDVTAGAGSIEIGDTASIGGDLDAGAGYLSVDGTVDGDVRVGAETVVLGPNADIGGEFRYDAESFDHDAEATVAGGVVQDDSIRSEAGWTFDEFALPNWVGIVYGLFANLLLGVLLLGLFPSFSTRVANSVADKPVKTGGVGLLTVIAVPLVLLALLVTIIGIPLSLVGFAVFLVTAWIASVYGQYAVGAWGLGLVDRENRWLALVVGLVGFAILAFIPVLGGLLEFVAFLLGLGALTLALRDAYRGRSGEDAARGRQMTLDEASPDTSATSD